MAQIVANSGRAPNSWGFIFFPFKVLVRKKVVNKK